MLHYSEIKAKKLYLSNLKVFLSTTTILNQESVHNTRSKVCMIDYLSGNRKLLSKSMFII